MYQAKELDPDENWNLPNWKPGLAILIGQVRKSGALFRGTWLMRPVTDTHELP
jgi:hypothetical protein